MLIWALTVVLVVLFVVAYSSLIPAMRHNVLLNSLPVIDRITKFIEDFKTKRKWFTDIIVIIYGGT